MKKFNNFELALFWYIHIKLDGGQKMYHKVERNYNYDEEWFKTSHKDILKHSFTAIILLRIRS